MLLALEAVLLTFWMPIRGPNPAPIDTLDEQGHDHTASVATAFLPNVAAAGRPAACPIVIVQCFFRTSKIFEASIWKSKGPAVSRAFLSITSAAGFFNELGRYAGWRFANVAKQHSHVPCLGCPSADNLRLVRCFEKEGSGSSGLEFRRPAADAASVGLR